MSSEDVSTKSGPARACGGRDSPVSPEQTTGGCTGDRKLQLMSRMVFLRHPLALSSRVGSFHISVTLDLQYSAIQN